MSFVDASIRNNSLNIGNLNADQMMDFWEA